MAFLLPWLFSEGYRDTETVPPATEDGHDQQPPPPPTSAEPKDQKPVQPPPAVPASGPGTFTTAPAGEAGLATGTTYRIEIEDGAALEPTGVARQIAAILDDRRGWRTVGATFRQVTTPDAELVFRIATPATTDRLCDVRQPGHIGEVNCRTGPTVVINLKRWQLGSDRFSGPATEYRALIVNHEIGHWLGRGHLTCPGPGRPAPAMMQQIDGLKGCVSNAWPYDDSGGYLDGPAVP
ncbi:DUF3152 domain-containing protein [Streptomyces sp. NPDC098789]|uniref:DUF3152 domain-containing protein n=1 Tax=Streptomyces sp. NPDC098789 TaxID=3366098 RepID=UPI0038255B19